MPARTKNPSPGGRSGRAKRIAWIAAAAVAAGGVAGLFAFTGGSDGPKPKPSPVSFPQDEGVPFAEAGCQPVQTPPYQGHEEVRPGDAHPAYNTDPPTSGWYLIARPNAGFYGIPLPIERIMNLPANGGIGIWVSQSEATTTRRFMSALGSSDVIATVWPGVKEGVVFTAWGVIQRCKRFSGEAAIAFIQQYRLTALKQREPDFVPNSVPTSFPSKGPSPSGS